MGLCDAKTMGSPTPKSCAGGIVVVGMGCDSGVFSCCFPSMVVWMGEDGQAGLVMLMFHILVKFYLEYPVRYY